MSNAAMEKFLSEEAQKKPYAKDIPLDRIILDAGTQQRPTVPEVVDEYKERLALSEPPPGRAVNEDGKIYLWEGFHRAAALKAAGRETMRLAITAGTLRDAILLSYSANRDHGVRRQPGVVGAIVRNILADDQWKKASAKQIAEHVGASQRYVESVIAEAKAEKGSTGKGAERPKTREVTRGGKTFEMDTTGQSERKRTTANRTAGTVAAMELTEPANGNGAPVAEPPPAEEEKPELVTVDALGNKLTDPDHVDVFTRAFLIDAEVKKLREVKKTVLEFAAPKAAEGKQPDPDPLYQFLVVPDFKADIGNAIDTLRFAAPYALCPVHPDDVTARKDCKWCNGSGIVNERKYRAALDSMKPAEAGAKGKK